MSRLAPFAAAIAVESFGVFLVSTRNGPRCYSGYEINKAVSVHAQNINEMRYATLPAHVGFPLTR